MSFKSTFAPFPIKGQYTLEEAEKGTRVTFIIEADLSGVFKMAETIVVQSAKRQMNTDFSKLKSLLEASA